MVLVVVPDVQREAVQPAVVAVRLLALEEQVVLLDPACAEGMEAHAEEEGNQEIGERPGAEDEPHGHVEGDLHDQVQHDPVVDRPDLAQARRPRALDQGKQEKPDRLAPWRGPDDARLPDVRKVGIELVHALERVVLEVVALEEHRARQAMGQVGDDPGKRVGPRCLENQVVRGFMDHHPERMVGERADERGREADQPPRARSQGDGQADLEGHRPQHDPERGRRLANELPDLGMLAQDAAGATAVGLGQVRDREAEARLGGHGGREHESSLFHKSGRGRQSAEGTARSSENFTRPFHRVHDDPTADCSG